MLRRPARLPGLLLLAASGLTLFAAPAEAGQLFVNPVTGSDSNAGTSPATAFKTIRKALQVAPPFNDGIVLAPGEYGAVSGEAFPLPLGGTLLYGEGGSAVTRIVGSGNDILFDALGTGDPGSTVLNLEGLSLVGGRTGLRVNSPANHYVVKLHDLVISGMSQDGIECHAIPAGDTPSAISLIGTHLAITDSLRGLTMLSASPTLTSQVFLSTCRFERNAVGLNVESHGDVFANVFLSRFLDQSVLGARAFANGGNAELALDSSLVAGNAVGVESGGLDGVSSLSILGCTIVDNGIGVFTDLPVPPVSTSIGATILWDNGDDLHLAGPVSAQHSDVSDGDFGSTSGNVSADPLFRDAAARDYRLSWGSPAIESGGPNPSFDLLGNVRPVDGDLDAWADMDMGCFEFMPLELVTTQMNGLLPVLPPGGLLHLEAWGASSATAVLFVAPNQFGCLLNTAFGTFFLNPVSFLPLGTLAVGPTVPGVLQATIPASPVLQGLFFSFQTLTTSALAPKGKALSGPVQFLVGA